MAVETIHAIVRWLANLNIKRNLTSMFVNKKHRYLGFKLLRVNCITVMWEILVVFGNTFN